MDCVKKQEGRRERGGQAEGRMIDGVGSLRS